MILPYKLHARNKAGKLYQSIKMNSYTFSLCFFAEQVLIIHLQKGPHLINANEFHSLKEIFCNRSVPQ